jgi:hypothetical protein
MNDPEIGPARIPRRPAARLAGGVVMAAVVLIVVLLATSGHDQSRSPVTTGPGQHSQSNPAGQPTSAEVTIRSNATLTGIPRSFLGLSTEYWTLPVDERHVRLYRRVLSLLHVPGDGPFVLRIGGDSSDHTFFDPTIVKLPRWAFRLTPEFIARTARIVREMRLRVIVDLNLITSTPSLVAAWAREALRVMPRGSIIGFEIGNEPDLYSQAFWLLATAADRFGGRVLPPDITAASYAQEFNSYARVLARVAPGVPLLAPALADPNGDAGWIRTLLAGPHPGLGIISGHRYPYSACAFPGTSQYPTIDRVLSETATAGMARTLRRAIRLAHRAGLPFRLTELNSITCGGLPGVSNAFATALWAPDAAFELIRAGVQGFNLHARVFAINDPFTFDLRGLQTRPLLYGLILFARTLGPNSRLVPLRLRAERSLHLKAWAVKVSTNTLHVLLINKGSRSVTVRLNLPAGAPATVERLLAPSPSSRSDVTFGGQRLDQNGAWGGRRREETVTPRARRYSVALPHYSAALMTVQIAPGSLR